MHIPDGFLDTKTWISTTVASFGALGYIIRRLKDTFIDEKIPLMGVLAAFIFAAQMLNFPVAAGTSGHFLGAAMAIIFLGPLYGSMIMVAVVIIQALIFADGGITALGANIFNMAIIAPFIAYIVFTILRKNSGSKFSLTVATFLAAWVSVVISALVTGLELAVSGTVPLQLVLTAMFFWHALIGLAEGIITVAIVNLVSQVRGDLLDFKETADVKSLVVIFIIAILLAFFLAPFASSLPDGLERVAEDLGFIEKGAGGLGWPAVFPDYSTRLINNPIIATSLAGLAGILIIVIIAVIIYYKRRKNKQFQEENGHK